MQPLQPGGGVLVPPIEGRVEEKFDAILAGTGCSFVDVVVKNLLLEPQTWPITSNNLL